MKKTDVISPEQAGSLPGAFNERVKRTPDAIAYGQYDENSDRWKEYSWAEVNTEILRWRQALVEDGLKPGDRVAIMLRNCLHWVIMDQAALGLGLVIVPIYTNDRPQNINYIIQDAGARILLIEGDEQWQGLQEIHEPLSTLVRVVSLHQVQTGTAGPTVTTVSDWLPETFTPVQEPPVEPDSLASIVYTSGTTGKPKGVMLSHTNFLWNAWASLKAIDVYPGDLMLSFLPLSHALERMAGYYLPILAGSKVYYARSVPQLAEDLVRVRPTILIAVPRIFERVYGKIYEKLKAGPGVSRKLFNSAVNVGYKKFEHGQHRAGWSPAMLGWPLLEKLVAKKVQGKLGGRLRFAVSGGAPLSAEIARMFIGLGISIQQGYGLTETSPVIAANSMEDNVPTSVGVPIQGVEVRVGEQNELMTRGPCVMMGYWNRPDATKETIEPDGWLHTGDQAKIENNHVFITGRIKDIIVLANGEKLPPADMEMAVALDGLFEQVLILGEGRPYLVALLVLNAEELTGFIQKLGPDWDEERIFKDESVKSILAKRVNEQLRDFPGYAKIRQIALVREPWDIDSGFMTPTMKLRRAKIYARYSDLIESLYDGH
ncbi:MAG: long-chain fatty acid--CoA ligase [Gammaproteobacteria bacterium]|nr:long-chain fatty acid--CoA ligase [Gammaproteobacteria bacterium]